MYKGTLIFPTQQSDLYEKLGPLFLFHNFVNKYPYFSVSHIAFIY